jgi:hypothetical protein
MSASLDEILKAACAFLSTETQARGEPWHARVQDMRVERCEGTRTLRATVTLELVSTEAMQRAAYVGPAPSGRAMAILEPEPWQPWKHRPPWEYPEHAKKAHDEDNANRAKLWPPGTYVNDLGTLIPEPKGPRARVSEALADGAMKVMRDREDAAFLGDAGQRAGVRALLEKFQKGIENATELATAREPNKAARAAVMAAENVKANDPVAVLLLAVQNQRRRVEEMLRKYEEALEHKKEDPEEALRRRVRLQVRAQYASEERMLREFQSFLWTNYSALLPEHQKPNAVPDFLQHIEDNDDAYSG